MYGITSFFNNAMILFVLGSIASIVLAILAYFKFLGKRADKRSRGSRFFNFDHLYIEKILKFFYLFGAIGITVFSICMPIFGFMSGASGMSGMSGYSSHSFDFGGAFIGFFSLLIVGIFFFAISQIVYRLIYEALLMFVKLVSDTNSIRRHVVGSDDSPLELTNERPTSPQPSYSPAAAPLPTAAADKTWTCQCGHAGNQGRFCPKCGSPRL